MQQKSQLFCIRYKLILRHGEMFDSSWSDEIMQMTQAQELLYSLYYTTKLQCL